MSKSIVGLIIVSFLVVIGGVYYFFFRPAPPLDTPPADITSKTITLMAYNNSGQSGTALLEQVGNQVRVTLALQGGNYPDLQPAHIHTGSCANYGAIIYPLNQVTAGSSQTTINTTMNQLLSRGQLALNIHKSAQELAVQTACGDF